MNVKKNIYFCDSFNLRNNSMKLQKFYIYSFLLRYRYRALIWFRKRKQIFVLPLQFLWKRQIYSIGFFFFQQLRGIYDRKCSELEADRGNCFDGISRLNSNLNQINVSSKIRKKNWRFLLEV